VIHSLLDLMYAKRPTQFQRAMHIHPTVSELLPTMMNQLRLYRRRWAKTLAQTMN